MVLPIAAAARAATAAGNAGATVLGLGMGQTDLDLTRDLFKKQMRQAKRLWTADWAESSLRHGEQCMQAAQQHAEAQAMAMASYYQAEKLAGQGIKLARDQDSRSYEMAWRAEVRESLRDELTNQYNRFNIVMLCDTVCLSCLFSLVAEGSLPDGTELWMINLYVLFLGLSITLFTISLWCAVIAIRRLHEHTAAILERKLFTQSEDLQNIWRQQLELNLPTGPNEIYLFNLAYEKWVAEYLHPIGEPSIHMMSFGVVTMFITAGLVTHNRYIIEYDAINAVYIFWTMVGITVLTVMVMKFAEDRKEKKKEGVYDNSWQDDQDVVEKGPFAKISRAAKELFSVPAVELASTLRMESMDKYERQEKNLCAETKALHHRVDSLRKEAEQRAKTRKDVLQILTTAAEELDALPEELTSKLNKLLHEIDEADQRTADLVTVYNDERDHPLSMQGASRSGWSRLPSLPGTIRPPMAPHPMDAQRLPVSLGSLRKKLGESSLSTLLRIKNLSNEALRLRSGVQLKEGKYVQGLNGTDPNDNPVCYHLYPCTEIPPRSEIVVAAKNTGGFLPTSGVEGQVVYSNKDETWMFRIKFSNHLLQRTRKCFVEATRVSVDSGGGGGPTSNGDNINYNSNNDDDIEYNTDTDMMGGLKFWSITKEELDIKANNEILITMDVLEGAQGRKAVLNHAHSQRAIKSGMLLKNRVFGLGLQWHNRWVVLTPTDIVFSETATSVKKSKISLLDIVKVQKCTDLVHNYAFEIHVRVDGIAPYKFAATSIDERKDWIERIMDTTERRKVTYRDIIANNSNSSRRGGKDGGGGGGSCSVTSESVAQEDGFECVQNDIGFSILSI